MVRKHSLLSALSLLLFICMAFFAQAENYPYRSDYLWVTTPSHDNWLYQLNEKATVKVSLYHYGMQLETGTIHYSIGPDMLDADTQGEITLNQGIATINVGTMNKPGFRDLRLEYKEGTRVVRHHLKVGFEPDKLTPYTTQPTDFLNYWQQAIDESKAIPLDVEKTFVPQFSNNMIDCYLLKIQVYKTGQYVYGYLTVPKKDGKYPLVFSPPGAGIKPMTPEKHLFYAENGMIRFDMEIHGIRPNLDKTTYKEVSRAFGTGNNSYLVNGLDDKDSYYMKKVYVSLFRVLDYLTTEPKWDGKNLIVQGASQGGGLALVTAGLDKRVTAVAVNHPALADMAGYKAGRAGGYPHLFTRFTGMDTPEKLATLPYYDAVNFARLITVPVFMTWGYNDNTCPPTTSYIVYNTLTSDKEALITPITEHWVSTETRWKILHWIERQLH
ncbi:acetylxylan esterase [Vibrio tritonius]|uniref:acetylxylan esterase n=1 Tax=Vibrio tritonius TaxID=1435069 RepID=UPI00315D6C20